MYSDEKNEMKKILLQSFVETFGYEPIVGGDCVDRAIKHICRGMYEPEDVIEIFDKSIFKEGTAGVVLTTEAICVLDVAHRPSKFIARYADFFGYTDIEYKNYWYWEENPFGGRKCLTESPRESMIEIEMKNGALYKLDVDYLFEHSNESNPKAQSLSSFLDRAYELYRDMTV